MVAVVVAVVVAVCDCAYLLVPSYHFVFSIDAPGKARSFAGAHGPIPQSILELLVISVSSASP